MQVLLDNEYRLQNFDLWSVSDIKVSGRCKQKYLKGISHIVFGGRFWAFEVIITIRNVETVFWAIICDFWASFLSKFESRLVFKPRRVKEYLWYYNIKLELGNISWFKWKWYCFYSIKMKFNKYTNSNGSPVLSYTDTKTNTVRTVKSDRLLYHLHLKILC